MYHKYVYCSGVFITNKMGDREAQFQQQRNSHASWNPYGMVPFNLNEMSQEQINQMNMNSMMMQQMMRGAGSFNFLL